MSEMNQPENTEIQKLNTEAYISERQLWIREAVEVIAGQADADPAIVLPQATEVRADGPALELDQTQEGALREIAGRFGIGGESDVQSGASHQVIEGGLAWKVDAEIAIEDATQTLVFAGSENRVINREDEIAYLTDRLGEDASKPENEYEMVKSLARKHPDFEALDEEIILPYGYDIHNDFALLKEKTGQLVQIGINRDRPVIVLKVNREDYIDDDGMSKYRNQPDSADLMRIVADIALELGDDSASVGLNTSNTYSSRAIDAVRAGLGRNREFSVGMYGRQTLADVKHEDIVEPTAINQIPGELHTIFTKLQKFEEELKQQ